MIVVVANNKGGQGKTFISTLLAYCLMKHPDNKGKLVFCDRNKAQKNFTQNLSHNKDIQVTSDDPLVGTRLDKRLWLVDTSPDIFENMRLIQKADVVIVPVGEGVHSLHGLKRIHEIRCKQDMKVILNEWSNTGSQRKIEAHLKQEGYDIVGHLPKYRKIMNNLDTHKPWEYGLTEKQAQSVIALLLGIFKRG